MLGAFQQTSIKSAKISTLFQNFSNPEKTHTFVAPNPHKSAAAVAEIINQPNCLSCAKCIRLSTAFAGLLAKSRYKSLVWLLAYAYLDLHERNAHQQLADPGA